MYGAIPPLPLRFLRTPTTKRHKGYATAQVFSSRLVTQEALVHAQKSSCGCAMGKVVLGEGFLPALQFSPRQRHSTQFKIHSPVIRRTYNGRTEGHNTIMKKRTLAGVAQSVQRLATGLPAWGSNPDQGQIFRTHPDRPCVPPSLLYNGHRVSFPGLRRPGRGVNHPPPSSAEVKQRVGIYLYSHSGPSEPVTGQNLPFNEEKNAISASSKLSRVAL